MSDKVRVYEIAEEAGASSSDVITKAKDLGIIVVSPQSAVSYEDAEEITKYIMTGNSSRLKTNSKKIKKIKKELEKKELLPKNNIKIVEKPELKKVIISKPTKMIPIKNLAREIITPQILIDYAKKLDYENIKLPNTKISNEIALNLTNSIQKILLENKSNENNIFSDTFNESKYLFSKITIEYKFKYKNILFKGVPGTGKSRTIDKIIEKHLNLKEYPENILRINIHSSSSNSDLMQGIGINSYEGVIEYKEKQGLILNFIQKATFSPLQPFVLILEEIQENSLNELIGDLIYLIEDNKRTKIVSADDEKYTYEELIEKFKKDKVKINSVKIPNLVSQNNIYKTMILPNNLFIFCTSNYRDDKKVIEDNLLRRFDVIEIYPKYKKEIGKEFINQTISDFLEKLNKSILEFCSEKGEIHPDRFMIGHSIWLKVDNKQDFERTFLKVITEFKDVKDFHFDDFKEIIKDIEFPFDIEKDYTTYQAWINNLQKNCYDFLEYK